MKNLFLIMVLSVITCIPAFATNVEVEALSDFSTDNPPEFYSVKTIEPISSKKGTLESGCIIEGKITAKDAKRLKRDATFSFVPIRIHTPQGDIIEVKKDFIGKYKKEVDKKKIAKSAVLSAGNFVVKGFSTEFTALEGAVKNKQGNRLKSSVVAVYEDSPISYIQKGKALEIKQGEHFYMNFKTDDNDDETENSSDIEN